MPEPHYIVKGIDSKPSDGSTYVRKDIDDWYKEQTNDKHPKKRIQLTLFLRALAIIQSRKVEDKLSYFRLAAIHSAPWCEWDQTSPKRDNNGGTAGFCVHNNYTFPTWHRVYMLLYEVCHCESLQDK